MKPERDMRWQPFIAALTRRGLMAKQTALTKRRGLRYPVIAAPLGRGSTPQFLAALAREGAMGFVALMHMPEPEVRQTLSAYVAVAGAGNRFGVNLTLIVDQTRRLEAALEEGCRVILHLMRVGLGTRAQPCFGPSRDRPTRRVLRTSGWISLWYKVARSAVIL